MADKVKLQVGERMFTTTKETLVGESTYFASLLSGRWQNQEDEDGVLFVDADPELFSEILRYLRSGNYPLFFNAGSNAFDYAKYTALLGETQYFGISKLEAWIQAQRYLEAVRLESHVTIEEDTSDQFKQSECADRKREYTFFPTIRKVYQCPRGIRLHDGNEDKCGQRCRKAWVDDTPEYIEKEVDSLMTVETRCVFNPDVCLGRHVDSV